MKKFDFVKIVALLVCCTMCIAAMLMLSSASGASYEFEPDYDFGDMTTVYLSENAMGAGDGSSEENAMSGDIGDAYKKLPLEGGRIVILTDIQVLGDRALKVNGGESIASGAVYIQGIEQADGSYSQLNFCKSSSFEQHLRIFGTTVFLDIELYKSTANNLWIASNGYELTIGRNVKTVREDGAYLNITAGVGGASFYKDIVSSPVASNIYSGEWDIVSAASWCLGAAYDCEAEGIVNIYGGNISTLYTKRVHYTLENVVSATVNYYGGNVTTVIGEYEEGEITSHTLNLMGVSKAQAEIVNYDGVFSSGGIGTINEIEKTETNVTEAPETTMPDTQAEETTMPDTQVEETAASPESEDTTAAADTSSDQSETSSEDTSEFSNIVYISSTGDDNNDGKCTSNAVKTLERATTLLSESGGEIIVLDDVVQDVSSYSPASTGNACRIVLATNTSPIYIHGVKKSDNTYTSLIFKVAELQQSSVAYGVSIELGGPTFIYDLTLGTEFTNADTVSDAACDLWISANAYSFTAGENIGVKFFCNGVVNNAKGLKTCGGQQDNRYSSALNTSDTSVINIFSGRWSDVYATSFSRGANQSNGGILNIYGGTITNVYATREGSTVIGDIEINYHGGDISLITGYEKSERTNTLNLIGMSKAEASGIGAYEGVFAENVDTVRENVGISLPDVPNTDTPDTTESSETTDIPEVTDTTEITDTNESTDTTQSSDTAETDVSTEVQDIPENTEAYGTTDVPQATDTQTVLTEDSQQSPQNNIADTQQSSEESEAVATAPSEVYDPDSTELEQSNQENQDAGNVVAEQNDIAAHNQVSDADKDKGCGGTVDIGILAVVCAACISGLVTRKRKE